MTRFHSITKENLGHAMVRKAIDALENQEAGNICPSILVSVKLFIVI